MLRAIAVAVLAIGIILVALVEAPIPAVALTAVTGVTILLLLWPRSSRDSVAPSAPEPPMADARAPIEAISDPLLIVAGSRVEQANAAARKLFGAHVVGEDVRVAIRHPAATDRLAARQATADQEPIELAGIGGRDNRWQMHVADLAGDRALVHLVDRSEGHAAERMRVDFVANASHELRTPLAAILGYVETLDDDAAAEAGTRKRFLRIIRDEAWRMQRLVEDLMSLSRIEAEKFRAPETAVDLAGLAKEVHATIRDAADPRSCDVAIAIDEGLPLVAGDRAQLSQLLHNLVGNAMKYGRPGTPVTIRASRGPGAMVRLSVEDQGDGIAPEHLPRLTERFYRVAPSRSRSLGGTGLGLAIVKHIVERHRGRLDIRSTPGEGTIVNALLPIAPLSSNRNATVTGPA
ncbi:ATPase [Sphingomonas sp. MAH-20]|uniref:histidine kinase n=1 Tax=Sphingomonas horti TaxID=2682842 RepID=A0A6I4J1B7_9SPHN|nr:MULTISPECIES: ATP-binding protein [Sphingomonas]MBA2919803.1 ATPase [Sphingomonas sp. CGMCC 1.13658]MVO78044.1 ATPase [Sphingomonas horti]